MPNRSRAKNHSSFLRSFADTRRQWDSPDTALTLVVHPSFAVFAVFFRIF
jgi:hypothetical protein